MAAPVSLGLRASAKAATRKRILLSAAVLFRMHGFDGVNIRAIATHAGMSTGAVFASFADKADLYTAAMNRPAPIGPLREAAPDMLAQLVKAESFIRGFEDDAQQAGVRELLAEIRDVIERAEAA